MAEIDTIHVGAGPYRFRCRAAGPAEGRLVLLLHGFPQHSLEWRHQLSTLADLGYRAVAPDQRGYSPGARPSGVEQYRLAHLVADVLAIADDMGGHRFDVVGHDWGAAVAWQVAGRYPDRVRTLAAVSVPHPAAFGEALASGAGDQAGRSSYMQFFRTPEEPERALLADGAAGLRGLFQASGMPAEVDIEPYVELLTEPGALTAALNWYRAVDIGDASAMGPVSSPTLYVWSTEDVALGREAAEATERHVDGPYRFEVLDGVSHWIPDQAPDALTDLLVAHLSTYN